MEVGLSRGRVVSASSGGVAGRLVGAVFPGRRERAQLFGGDARLIFEGWVPHDPVFVAVRGLVSMDAEVAGWPSAFAGCAG
jgi:hypothetical protein